jgi:uncharacterized protein involved in type VI secretion and phage assembly
VNDPGLQEVLERLRNRFFGKYRGSCTQVDADTMRIKAKVPAVLADQETGWCMPCLPYAGDQVGLVFLPEVGSGVWIEFEGGDVSYPIWVGCYWREGEKPSQAAPAVKVIITKQYQMLFDDDTPTATLADSDNSVTMDGSGVKLARGSNSVAIGDDKVSVNDDALEVTPGP